MLMQCFSDHKINDAKLNIMFAVPRVTNNLFPVLLSAFILMANEVFVYMGISIQAGLSRLS